MPKAHPNEVAKKRSSNYKLRHAAVLVFIAVGAMSNSRHLMQRYLQVTISPQQISKKPTFYRFFEVYNQIMEMANEKSPQGMTQPGSNSAFSRATVIHHAPWLPRRRMCKETCCVQAVAISLDQDKQQLIHCRDGIDLADIHLPMFDTRRDYMPIHAANFNEALLPCLLPGTIIDIQHGSLFWEKFRAKVQVPYVLTTMGSDGDSPWGGETYLADPLLLRWYGLNPTVIHAPGFQEKKDKFQALNMGLSGFNHPQEQYMLPFQKINNFTNPFLDTSRWDLSRHPLDFDKDVFVQFGNHWLEKRAALWKTLCPNTTVFNNTSCGSETSQVPVHKIYSDMSRYRFGVSPPGNGWDCYRTYEMLYLGVIPIVEERDSYSRELFEGLPVILVPNLGVGTSRQDIMNAIHSYTASDAFQNASFVSGWERLFFHYRRRQILKDSGRDKEILVDDNGREYYQAYHYTALGEEHGKHTFCMSDPEVNCRVEESEKDFRWLEKPLEMSELDKNWLAEWEARGKTLPRWEFQHKFQR
jgi:hypothetical protein